MRSPRQTIDGTKADDAGVILRVTLGKIATDSRVWLGYARPAPALREYVSGYHFFEIDTGAGDPIDDFNYPGWTLIRFTLGGAPWIARNGAITGEAPPAALFGVSSRATHIRTHGGLMVGAGITPLGWARLFRDDASMFADKMVPLGCVIGDSAEHLRLRLRRCTDEKAWTAEFDAFFTERLEASPPLPRDVRAIHRMLLDPEVQDVEQIAESLALTPRHVQRIALRIFGLPPKVLMRRARFLRAAMPLRSADPRPLQERIAADYADYGQFARDCRAFLGMSPSDYLARQRPISDASTTARAAGLGAPAQALHDPGGG